MSEKWEFECITLSQDLVLYRLDRHVLAIACYDENSQHGCEVQLTVPQARAFAQAILKDDLEATDWVCEPVEEVG